MGTKDGDNSMQSILITVGILVVSGVVMFMAILKSDRQFGPGAAMLNDNSGPVEEGILPPPTPDNPRMPGAVAPTAPEVPPTPALADPDEGDDVDENTSGEDASGEASAEEADRQANEDEESD